MALPFELTTFPSGALDIIRYLARQDSYAAFDTEIIAALGLSDRAFGKALRRLVTREYVEMQYDGSYVLTQLGIEAAEAIAAHDEEALQEGFVEEGGLEELASPDEETARVASSADTWEDTDDNLAVDLAAIETVARRALVIVPSALAVGRPAFLFVRVDEPAEPLRHPLDVDVLFRLSGDLDIFPDQSDTTAPAEGPAVPVRFEITPRRAGKLRLTIEADQITRLDLQPAGRLQLTLTAVDGPPAETFRLHTFDLTLQPGL
ncbi:MAG: hypothetical protein HPY64_13425 [Anaerolineae bacterium]|nr:hypothetical protein [Anaerolineae bacterium]